VRVVHVTVTMTEQRIRTKFCQKLGHSCLETYNMIQKAFGNKTMGCTHVKDGLGSSKRDRHQSRVMNGQGGPPTSRNQLMIDIVNSAMLDSQRMTTRKLSDELGLLFGLVQSILKEDVDMKHVSAKFVPQVLTVKQKETHLAVDRDLLQCAIMTQTS